MLQIIHIIFRTNHPSIFLPTKANHSSILLPEEADHPSNHPHHLSGKSLSIVLLTKAKH